MLFRLSAIGEVRKGLGMHPAFAFHCIEAEQGLQSVPERRIALKRTLGHRERLGTKAEGLGGGPGFREFDEEMREERMGAANLLW